MCGIAVLFGNSIDKETLEALVPMTTLVAHRGPDGEGFKYFEKGALGHRRLAIVDLSAAGLQPMSTPDKRFWITYNGEIYNYKELREELGGQFATETDTEVLLAAYQKWGVDALKRLNGMFAFSIYDTQEHTLFAARDRFGVKPLYYWRTPKGVIALASEIKQFTCLPGWRGKLNGQMAHDYLNWGVKDHTSETLFKNVFQLKGGEYILLRAGEEIQPKRWYHLPSHTFQGSLQEASTAFTTLLEDAVRLRLCADVDVGSCLSGGLDSSSIVCLSQTLLKGQKQFAFIARSDVPRFDESSFAQAVVSATNVSPQFTTPSLRTLFEKQGEIVWAQDEPFVSTSQFAQWSVFELVKQHHVKVVLNGQGSDEQLAGYPGFFGNRFFDLFVAARWFTLFREIKSTKAFHPTLEPIALLANKLTPDALRQPLRKWLGKSTQYSGWFNTEKLKADPRDPFGGEPHKSVANQCRQQLFRSSLPMLLHYEDRNSMAHSIESRTPFLDYRLVELIASFPSEFKISDGWTKKVLREGMKGILPEEIRLRKDKLGFVTAEEQWMLHDAPDLFRQKIKEAVESSQGIITPTALLACEEIISGKRPFNFLPWRLICFGEWLKRFSIQLT